jgi:hypothetical protein
LSNPDPSPGTRFKPGNRVNPGGRKKDDLPKIDLVAEMRRQLASVDPETRLSKAEELIGALLEAGCGGDVRAIQEVLSRIHGRIEPRMAAAKFEEHVQARTTAALLDQAERTERTEQIDLGVDLLCGSDPAITRPMAVQYMSELLPLLEAQRRSVALIRGANPLAPLVKSPTEMEEELIRRTWRELEMPGDPDSLCRLDGPGAPPPPSPAGGPEPEPPAEPDQDFLAARTVEAERERRERAKHPMQQSPSPPRPEPARPDPASRAHAHGAGSPPAPPPPPPLPDPSQFVRMGDMCIYLPED